MNSGDEHSPGVATQVRLQQAGELGVPERQPGALAAISQLGNYIAKHQQGEVNMRSLRPASRSHTVKLGQFRT